MMNPDQLKSAIDQLQGFLKGNTPVEGETKGLMEQLIEKGKELLNDQSGEKKTGFGGLTSMVSAGLKYKGALEVATKLLDQVKTSHPQIAAVIAKIIASLTNAK